MLSTCKQCGGWLDVELELSAGICQSCINELDFGEDDNEDDEQELCDECGRPECSHDPECTNDDHPEY